MNLSGVAGFLAQSIREVEPWTTQTRLAAVGLLLIVGVAGWALIRVTGRR